MYSPVTNPPVRGVISQGKYDKADSLFQRALAMEEKVHGPDHPIVAVYLVRHAEALKEQVMTDGQRD